MERKISLNVSLAATLLAMALTFSVTMVFSMRVFDATVNNMRQQEAINAKLSEINKYVRGNYYSEIDEDSISDRTARGFLEGLNDSRNVYYSAEEYAELQKIEKGELVSIGIEIIRDTNNYFQIAKVYAGSPAEAEGIAKGFQILKVGDVEVNKVATVKAVEALLRGTPGTEVTIVCLSGADEQSFTVQRINFASPSMEHTITDDGFGYIRIFRFGANSAAELDNALADLESKNAKGILFDLRGTGARSDENAYKQAYKMIDRLCPLGTSATGEYKGGITKVLATSNAELFLNLPMVTLINESTAGPAELFAFNIRSLANGYIAGVKSVGDGMLLSAPYKLSDGSAVSIIVARITAGKEGNQVVYEGEGIAVDVESSVPAKDFLLDYLYNVDFRNDAQLKRGMEWLGRMVGSGGDPPVDSSNPQDPGSAAPEDSTPPESDSSAA